jgi:hypothetical protein
MKIIDSQVQMHSAHRYSEQHVRHEQFQAWVGDRPPPATTGESGPVETGQARSLDDLQQRLHQLQSTQDSLISAQARSLAPSKALLTDKLARDTQDESYQDLEVSLIKALVERFSGRKIELFKPSDFQPRGMDVPSRAGAEGPSQEAPAEGWGLIYDYYASYQETESSSFSAKGLVKTADGQEIAVDLQLNMSRQFESVQQINLRAGDALKDPLVVNFGAAAAELTQRRFAFDLDLDGRMDQLAMLAPGSAFLALDKNADGIINDGTELFGPTSGSGFAELARHDQDANGWIDEADAVYDRLRLWRKDENGSDSLLGLGQAGVGAIYLGHVNSPFLLKDSGNQLLGQVRETGLFLDHEGIAGSVQELDLVV